ncbi:DinB family protein [Bernardetia sp. Wsw4-3y2]|uniref:DinB family protein n=1 Tax=unclassified Bernardetia TaxID=2647129 RepID=UPI0030D33DBB
MKIQTSKLNQSLIEEIKTILQKTVQLQQLSNDELNFRPNTESWTVLECIEHLNRYSIFYLEEIEKRIDEKIDKNKLTSNQDYIFKSGFLGNYSANSMLPVQKGIVSISENKSPTANHSLRIGNKMKTFKDKNPIHSGVDRRVLDTFIDDQNEFMRLLEKAQQVDWNKTKVSLTLPLLKFNLGDTFRFVINHEIRHFIQIKNILSNTQLKN